LAEIEAIGLRIKVTKYIRLTKKEVDIIWEPCSKETFYDVFLKFSTSSDCLVFIVEGEKAINRLNELVGHYEPSQAGKNTIRHRFGKSPMENVIHSTLNEQTFWKEAMLFFSYKELQSLLNQDLESRSPIK